MLRRFLPHCVTPHDRVTRDVISRHAASTHVVAPQPRLLGMTFDFNSPWRLVGGGLLVAASSGLAQTASTTEPACPTLNPAALELAGVVARAVCLDPALARLRASAAQSQAVVAERQSAFAPTWQARIAPTLASQNGSGADTASASLAAQLQLSQVLADGGARSSRSAQALANATAAQAELRVQRLASQRDAVTVWADWLDARATTASATAGLSAAAQALAAAQARVSAGSAAQVDALAARAARASAQRSLDDAQAAEQRTTVTLAQRLNLPAPSLAPAATERTMELPSGAKLPGTAAEPLAAIHGHPQWQAQQARVQAAQAQRDAARAEDRPTLSASVAAGPGLSRSRSAGHTDSRTQFGTEVGVVWSVPLSDGGARASRVAQADAALRVEQARLLELERSLAEALLQAQVSVRSAAAQLASAVAALDAAAESEAAQAGRYQAGAGTLNDWLAAQGELANSRRLALQARQQQVRAAAQLSSALGPDWESQ